MDSATYIPASARLTCVACQSFYDYRVMPDRSCPECGCPAPTVRQTLQPDAEGRGFGTIVPNPAQAEWLAVNSQGRKAGVNSNTVNTDKASRADYMRRYMAKRRAAAKDSPSP